MMADCACLTAAIFNIYTANYYDTLRPASLDAQRYISGYRPSTSSDSQSVIYQQRNGASMPPTLYAPAPAKCHHGALFPAPFARVAPR